MRIDKSDTLNAKFFQTLASTYPEKTDKKWIYLGDLTFGFFFRLASLDSDKIQNPFGTIINDTIMLQY